MNTILVPLDGSSLAEQVLPYARLLATTLGTNLSLLQVVSDDARLSMVFEREALRESAYAPRALDTQRLPNDTVLRQHAESYLERVAQPLRDAGLSVQTEVAFGWPAEAIVERACENGARLIALGTHGYSGLQRWALGSVTDRVAHLAPMPVFVARTPAPAGLALRRILVPLDGSPEARAALPLALELAQQAGAAIDLLTVATPSIWLDPSLAPPVLFAEERPRLEARLLSEVDPLRDQVGSTSITPLVVEGLPADVICTTAKQRGADLIVMAAHGYSGIRRFMLGSTADKVLHASETPLLLVRCAR